MTAETNTSPDLNTRKEITELWAAYKAGGADSLTALDQIKVALCEKIHENPQAAALVASQIIGESEKNSESERMAADIFKRAAACVQLKNPMTLINMFSGCTQRMKPEQANRITHEARLFLGQISHGAPGRSIN